MEEFVTFAPTRIDLAGGTLDLWPIHHSLREPCTVNVAITAWAQVGLRLRNDRRILIESIDQGVREEHEGLEGIQPGRLRLITDILGSVWKNGWPGLDIRLKARSPKGAGLGGSSSLGVCLAHALAAFSHRQGLDAAGPPGPPAGEGAWTERRIVSLVRNVEARIINAPAGVQDHWAAVRGGINVLTYPDGGIEVETLDHRLAGELDRRLVLVYTGASRDSAMNNWTIFRNFYDGDAGTIRHMQEIADCARLCAAALRHGDLEGALRASKREWQARRLLWPTIMTSEFEAIEAAAHAAGADFARFCGAGGGGVMAVFCEAAKAATVRAACEAKGGQVLDVQVSADGVHAKNGAVLGF